MNIKIDNDSLGHERENAAETGSTFRALVEEGLRCVPDRAAESRSDQPFEVRVFTGFGDSPGLATPYDRIGLQRAILDSYRSFDDLRCALG
jgi:hypothetical protein